MRTGGYKEVRVKSHGAHVMRALLAARDMLVGIRVEIEKEMRGLLKTFGVMFGKKVGGFTRRADEIIADELSVSPELKIVIETLIAARRGILERMKVLDLRVHALAKQSRTARLFMTAPAVGTIAALSVASAYDDPSPFARSTTAGAYFGLTPDATSPARSAGTAGSRSGETG